MFILCVQLVNQKIFTHISDIILLPLFFLQLPQSKTPSKSNKNINKKTDTYTNTKIKTHFKAPYSTSNTNKINPSSSMDLQTPQSYCIFLSLHLLCHTSYTHLQFLPFNFILSSMYFSS